MGFWPFGASKKNRKRVSTDQTSSSLLEKSDSAPMARHAPPNPQYASPQTSKPESRRDSETKSRKLSKARPSSQKNSAYNLSHSYTSPASAQSIGGTPHRGAFLNPNMSQSSIGPENFSVTSQVPTLYARRQDYNPSVLRKKSSKRKAEDYARERELRAMSAPVPIPKPRRPATYSGSGPLQRELVNVSGDFHRPSSQVSLPVPESISEDEIARYQNSFKIGMFAALSPRPSVKYDSRNRNSVGKAPARMTPLQQTVEEDDLSFSRRRIDDLADDLDSAGLRELMERDRKRREKKRETDRQKLQRKLQRRADKEQEEKTRRTRAEEFARTSSANLNEQRAAAIQAVSKGKNVELEDPFADSMAHDPDQPESRSIRNPFDDEKDIDVMNESFDPEDEVVSPVAVQSPERKAKPTEPKRASVPPQAAISPPSSPINKSTEDRNTSQLSFKREPVPAEVLAGLQRDRQDSDQSAPQAGSWTSFFKRGTRRKDSVTDRSRLTPSEFSNTSRESFSRKPPPQLNTSQRTFRKSGSGTPQRTMSRFREDLPELPLSPPDSRLQSPDVPPASLPVNITGRGLAHSGSGHLDGRSVATTSSIPELDRVRGDSRVHSLLSGDSEAHGHALSQSLASVDSEGSWLSGKPVKRFSGPMNAKYLESNPKPDEMEEVLAEDEYLSRLSPEPENRRQSAISSGRRPSSTLLDLKAEQAGPTAKPAISKTAESGETWHAGLGRQPTVVRATNRAKSREGLLKDFQAADVENISSDEEGEGAGGDDDVQLMRARSVDYKKGHARNFSAGSAKVLDIKGGAVTSPPQSPAMRSGNTEAGQESSSHK